MAEAKPVPKEQKIFLGIVAIVGLFMFYKKAYVPQGRQIKELKKQIKSKRDEIERIKRKVARMAELEAEFERLKGDVAEAEKKLPKSEELPELIRGITAIGAKHGIEIDNLKISSVISKKFYQEHQYNFSITSTYHKIAQFFADICQEERIMTVRDLKLVPGTSKTTGNPQMRAMFTLVVYTYKE